MLIASVLRAVVSVGAAIHSGSRANAGGVVVTNRVASIDEAIIRSLVLRNLNMFTYLAYKSL
jgi:hypothetical protein